MAEDDVLECVQMCAASELKAEVWDIWSKSTAAKFDQKDSIDMGTMLEHSCFLGLVHVPLSETLPAAALQDTCGYNGPLMPGHQCQVTRECVLSRRHGGDRVQGVLLGARQLCSATASPRFRDGVWPLSD